MQETPVKLLGIYLQNNLNLSAHINHLWKRFSTATFVIWQLKNKFFSTIKIFLQKFVRIKEINEHCKSLFKQFRILTLPCC